MAGDGQRIVMIRDYYEVPGIPQEVLAQVFGNRNIDPHVERAALIYEYWASVGASPRLVVGYTLQALKSNSIDSNNIYDLISLLSKRNQAESFFGLTSTYIDRDGSFRRFLIENGVLIDTIRYYSKFNGIDPQLFIDGFIVGVADSFASVVVDLATLIKMIAEANAQFETLLVEGIVSPRETAERIGSQASAIGTAFFNLVNELDPSKIPSALLNKWLDWSKEFEKRLEALDPFAAGRFLGNLGGDLWQLLVGAIQLRLLLKAGMKAALRHAPLLFNTLRQSARALSVVIRDIVALLMEIGPKVIDAVTKVGIGVLQEFPARVLSQLFEQGRAVVADSGFTFTVIPQEAFALAGASSRGKFGVLLSQDDNAFAMAVMSDSSAMNGMISGGVGRAVDDSKVLVNITDAEIDALLEKAFKGLAGGNGKTNKGRVLDATKNGVEIAARAQLAQRLGPKLDEIVKRVAKSFFEKWHASGAKFNPGVFGTKVQEPIMKEMEIFVCSFGADIELLHDQSMLNMMKKAANIAGFTRDEWRAVEKVLEEPVYKFLHRRKDLLKIMNAEGALDSEADVIKYVKDRFGYKEGTTIGELKADGLILDAKYKTVHNIDITSSRNAEKVGEVWEAFKKELSLKPEGAKPEDIEKVIEQYNKLLDANAGKLPVPKMVAEKLGDLLWHIERETVLRQNALMEMFGPMWHVTSREVHYDPLVKLFKDFYDGLKR